MIPILHILDWSIWAGFLLFLIRRVRCFLLVLKCEYALLEDESAT